MTEHDIAEILNRQNDFFESGLTQSRETRLSSLENLRKAIEAYEDDLCNALKQDLGKSRTEAFMCEIGLILSEISWLKKHLRGLMREKRVRTPLAQ